MSDSRYYSKEFITEVIEMYKSFPCLWKIKSDDFKNRNLKDKAYGELIKKFQEVDSKADKQVVLKKFSSWRNSWKKEHRKVKESLKSGTLSEDLIYTPKLWYFEILSFIKDQEIDLPRKSISTLLDEDEMTTTREEEKEEDQEDFTEEILMDSPHSPKDSQGEENLENNDISFCCKRSRLSYPKRQMPQKEQLTAETDLGDLLKTLRSKIENHDTSDRFDYLAKNWAEKLRNIDSTQRIYAEKLVTDVFYEAELRSLSRASRLLVGDGSQSQYHDPHNAFSSFTPRHSTQSFTSAFTPISFHQGQVTQASSYCQQSSGSKQPMQDQITDDNFVIVKDEI